MTPTQGQQVGVAGPEMFNNLPSQSVAREADCAPFLPDLDHRSLETMIPYNTVSGVLSTTLLPKCSVSLGGATALTPFP